MSSELNICRQVMAFVESLKAEIQAIYAQPHRVLMKYTIERDAKLIEGLEITVTPISSGTVRKRKTRLGIRNLFHVIVLLRRKFQDAEEEIELLSSVTELLVRKFDKMEPEAPPGCLNLIVGEIESDKMYNARAVRGFNVFESFIVIPFQFYFDGNFVRNG